MDATPRSLENLGIKSCIVDFNTLRPDTMDWLATTTDAAGTGTIIPSLGQVVELWKDGVRKFRGYATAPTIKAKGIGIRVEGPWWWMERITLTQDQTDSTNATAERPSYVLPTQSLKTSIEAVINRAITNGVPMVLGSVASTYICPRITLAEMTCGAALSELMMWLPDAVAWFDYSVSGLPALNVSRRAGMATIELAIGTGGENGVEECEISPRLDQEVSNVTLSYVTRNPTTGLPAWASQSAGTVETGKRQIIAVSGPEIVDFLPKDDFESYAMQTTSNFHTSEIVKARSANIQMLGAHYGFFGGPASYVRTTVGFNTVIKYFPAPRVIDENGADISTYGKHLVVSTDAIPDWVIQKYNGKRVTVTGTWVATENVVMSAGTAAASENMLAWQSAGQSGYPEKLGSMYVFWAAVPYTYTGVLIDTAFTAQTTIYKPWEYDYITPPAGLADGLRLAQNWVPWEGSVTTVHSAVSASNTLPSKVRITGTLPQCATMDAILETVSHDLIRGRISYRLGAPARLDFGSLVNRVRRDPKDNIVYL